MFVSFVTFAQEKSKDDHKLSPEKRVELQVARLKIELDLTDKQTADVRKLFADGMEKRIKMREELKAKKADMPKPSPAEREQFKKIKEENKKAMEEQLKLILSPAQFETWLQIKADREKKRNARKDKEEAPEN